MLNMFDEKRKFEEVLAMAKLVPELKNIYVEGITDKIFIKDFLKEQQINNISVYSIDQIDFSEIFKQMDPTKVDIIEYNNKEKVIFLACELENNFGSELLHTICIIDADLDYALNNIRTGTYIKYTDYNSMELYLWSQETISRFLTLGHHIIRHINYTSFLDNLQEVCRQVFYIRYVLDKYKGAIIDNDRDFSFDKTTFTCKLNIGNYWNKVIQKNNLSSESQNLRKIFEENYKKAALDPRMEMRGHDFVHYLYLCVKSYKSLRMTQDEFGNMFWGFANYSELSQMPMFQRIISL